MTAARLLMVQGTASAVGKSTLVAALCRLFRREGLRVAPFKAQNMALNAAVTRDGGEIGRAQHSQALAAGAEPAVDMNPVLLKPEADARCQVVVLGRAWRTLAAREYYRVVDDLRPVALAALARLRAQHDLVLIEGAGSPAEVNLKERDIANMWLAQAADAPVLLVGDIDRGGVLAAFVGTLELLEPAERALVRGLVVNKVRGDAALLAPALDFLRQRTGRPVLGVLPYLPDLRLPEEDSTALDGRRSPRAGPDQLDVAVIRLPRIANFDEFDGLAGEPDVCLRFVADPGDLGAPDLLILPGSKSTVADLEALRRSGLAQRVVAFARAGGWLLGVCGGLQMLGTAIRDPHGVETAQPEALGLGLLPLVTTFAPTKRTCQVRARIVAAAGPLAAARGLVAHGYEMHMGASVTALPPSCVVVERQGRPADDPDGAVAADGSVTGTYLHGLFEQPALRRAVLDGLRARRGLPPLGLVAPPTDPYDALADALAPHLDWPALRALVGLA
ncbi:MAG: cobyric acid synthase [Chloroflexi bacterium]|nr:cobyric acid synthase [Chloroflexota bacterium]